MKQNHSPKFLRQRKMMLILPVLVIPFITMAFWALGGGKGDESKTIASNTGLNLQVPDANLKDDKNADKLAFYNAADADSLKREQLLQNDPYYKDSILGRQYSIQSQPESLAGYNQSLAGLNYSPYNKTADANEQKIYSKINEINRQINQANNQPVNDSFSNSHFGYNNDEQVALEVDRLQNMMQQMSGNPEQDPEMEQLNNTLEKILDIQHPERVKEKLKEQSKQTKETVFTVSRDKKVAGISLLDTSKNKQAQQTGFFGIENNTIAAEQNAIEAVIHQNQILVNGSIIKLRLLNDVYINGNIIPKGNFISGIASLNDERLTVEITSVRNNQSIFPVKLEVFDMDGLPGIYIPGAITRDVAKQSADNSLQLMELSTMDPSFKAQAAAAGITAAKSLISRKVKQVKVMVKAGYKVLLKDKNIQQ